MITTRQPENEDDAPTEPLEVKAARRSMIEEATAQFLASGGSVKQLPSCSFTPSKYERQHIDFSKKRNNP